MVQHMTYEAMVAAFGESPKQTKNEQQAIEARGGHCKNCSNCNKLTAILPAPFTWHRANQANYSVRVSCKIDDGKIYPHQGTGKCPAIRRYEQLQARQSQSQAA